MENATGFDRMNSTDGEDIGLSYTSPYVIINVLVVPVLCLFGFLGNGLSIAVLGRDKSMKKSARILLQALAIADIYYLGTSIVKDPMHVLFLWLPVYSPYLIYVVLYLFPLVSGAQTTATWMVVIVTADRYIAVCKPLHAARLSTMSRARKAVVCVWILSFLYNIPRFFERRIQTYWDVTANRPFLYLGNYALANDTYFIVYFICMYILFRILIPLCGLIFFNVRLAQAIAHSAHSHNQSGRKNTVMLIAVVAVFVVCQIPTFSIMLCELLVHFKVVDLQQAVLNEGVLYANLFLTINSSINFVIYYFLGQRFRQTLWEMFRRKPGRQSTQFRINYQTRTV